MSKNITILISLLLLNLLKASKI